MTVQAREGFRISPQQRRICRRALADGSAAYRATAQARLYGHLADDSWRHAVAMVVERHEILRTRFARSAGMALPLQVVETGADIVDLEICDRDGLPSADPCLEPARPASDSGDEQPRKPLTLRLVHLSQSEHLLTLWLPALHADAAALVQLIRELVRTHDAWQAGCTDSFETPAPQYADLAELFHQLLASEQATAAWRQLDGTDLTALRLPFTPAEPAAASPTLGFLPARHTVVLEPPLTTAIAAVAEARAVRPASFLLAIWNLLLWRLVAPRRALVGVAAAGRDYEGLERAVGLFAHYLPFDLEPTAQLRFDHYLLAVEAALANAEAHQHTFDWEALQKRPTAAAESPYFPFCFEHLPRPTSLTSGVLRCHFEQLEARFDRFDVCLSCRPGDHGTALVLDYDAKRYDASAARQLLATFAALARSAAHSPTSRLAHLDTIDAGERQRRRRRWNARTDREAPATCAHRLFEQQVARTPNRLAVVGPRGSWTYAELDDQARRLAGALIARGIEREAVVAVCLERQRQLPAALLGVLRAGAAFLPVDPSTPPQRLAAMLTDAGCRHIVVADSPLATLPDAVEPVRLGALPAASAASRWPDIDPCQLAYMVFTSGSSGRPKGVMVEHRSLTIYLAWAAEHLLADVDLLPLISRPTFDASFKQILAPLLRGGRVWTLPTTVRDNPVSLLAAVARQRRVGLNCVPSLWRVLLGTLESDRADALPEASLVALYLGGEPLEAELMRRTFAVLPWLKIWNLYGPTETTVNATAAAYHRMAAVDLGQPIASSRVDIVDDRLAPLAAGLAGEILIGGPSVARGYRARPGLTAERFRPDPFARQPGARVYCTGDRARWQADGRREFLGRLDRQIKLRGYRIELEEVEAVLRQTPGVADGVAVLRSFDDDTRLVAYVQTSASSALTEPELVEHLATRLPEPMVPSHVAFVPELPRTATGKIDRQRLAEIDPRQPELAASYVAPRSTTEELLATIWGELLGHRQIGAQANFYQLGGHSLLALEMLTRIQDAFAVRIPLEPILAPGSLEAVAASIDQARRGELGKQSMIVPGDPIELPAEPQQERSRP